MLNHIRGQIMLPGTKATETNKNVCVKQINFMTSSEILKGAHHFLSE